jgi:hypothetical protein
MSAVEPIGPYVYCTLEPRSVKVARFPLIEVHAKIIAGLRLGLEPVSSEELTVTRADGMRQEETTKSGSPFQ